jgi:hypothetical protein
MIDRLQGFFGFTRTPFGRDLAPGMLHRHAAHGEAVARIGWCVTEHRIGVITGEVGAGKTVAVRAALAALDPTRHTIIYLPNPTVGVRGIHHQIVAALGARPLTHHATPVLRRRDGADPPNQPRLPESGEQPRPPSPGRGLCRGQGHRRRVLHPRRGRRGHHRMITTTAAP